MVFRWLLLCVCVVVEGLSDAQVYETDEAFVGLSR